MLISFVIPCYKSAKTIGSVVSEIESTMQQHTKYDYEIILVNDCSPDCTTFPTIKKLSENNKKIIAIDLAKNKGQAAATMCGLRHASGDYVVCGDDDGQTPFDMIFQLKQKLDIENFDVVCGKYTSRDRASGFRSIGTKINEKMSHFIFEHPKELYLSAFFIAKRFVIDELVKYPNPYPYITGLLVQVTSRIGNVDVPQRKRISGNSGYSFKKLLSLWLNGFTAFSVKPLRFATFIGVLFAVLGFIITIVLIISRLFNENIAIGWTSLTALMLVVSGILSIIIGMVGEYIGRIYVSINKIPQYVVRENTKNTEDSNCTENSHNN